MDCLVAVVINIQGVERRLTSGEYSNRIMLLVRQGVKQTHLIFELFLTLSRDAFVVQK